MRLKATPGCFPHRRMMVIINLDSWAPNWSETQWCRARAMSGLPLLWRWSEGEGGRRQHSQWRPIRNLDHPSLFVTLCVTVRITNRVVSCLPSTMCIGQESRHAFEVCQSSFRNLLVKSGDGRSTCSFLNHCPIKTNGAYNHCYVMNIGTNRYVHQLTVTFIHTGPHFLARPNQAQNNGFTSIIQSSLASIYLAESIAF